MADLRNHPYKRVQDDRRETTTTPALLVSRSGDSPESGLATGDLYLDYALGGDGTLFCYGTGTPQLYTVAALS